MPAASPSVTVAVPASPFAVAVSADGCHVFASLMGQGSQRGIAVFRRAGGKMELRRVVPLRSNPAGMALTHDGRQLLVAAGDAVAFLDVRRLVSGDGEAVAGYLDSPPRSQSIYVNVTPDDKLAFVSEESSASISVIDLERARANGFRAAARIGSIPVGLAPIALTFSREAKLLYTTSQAALPEWEWPKACKPEGRGGANARPVNPEGAVVVIDVARARMDPATAVVARIPAGCSPVRMAIAPDGGRIYVTARNSNAVLAFDTAKLLTDQEHARIGAVPVGAAPVPVAVVANGRRVVAGNSNRFGGREAQDLTVIDASRMESGAAAVMGTIAAGAFPREMTVSADGRTLFLANFGSDSLQMIDVERLPVRGNR